MSYNRNFHFLQGPRPENRLGRYVANAITLIGAPVKVTANANIDANGMLPLDLATAPVAPLKTVHGILIWENPTADFPGRDPVLTREVDVDTCPAGAPVQLVSGSNVRVRLINTVANLFRGQTNYPARTMVAGLTIATPTIVRGDMLTPGPGADATGYWQETADPTLAWLRVSAVNADGSVDAQFTF